MSYTRNWILSVTAFLLVTIFTVQLCYQPQVEGMAEEIVAEQEEETPRNHYAAEKLSEATQSIVYLEDIEIPFEDQTVVVGQQEEQQEEMKELYSEQSYQPVDAANVEYSFSMEVTEEEKQVLYRIVMAEAGNEDMKGQILVANVILNRVRSYKFANTIKGVVFAKGQFSPVSNGSYYRVTPTASVKEAVERALQGEDYSRGALYFVSRSSTCTWFQDSLDFLFRHGDHSFYV